MGEEVIFAQPGCRSQLACQRKILSWEIGVNQPVLIPWVEASELLGEILLVPDLPVRMIVDFVSHRRGGLYGQKNDLLLRHYLMHCNNLSDIGWPKHLFLFRLKCPHFAIYPSPKVDAKLIVPFTAILMNFCFWMKALQQAYAESFKGLPL